MRRRHGYSRLTARQTPWLRNVGLTLLLLFAAAILIRFMPVPSNGTLTSAIIYTSTLLIAVSPIAILFDVAHRERPYHWVNHTLDHRVRNLINLLDVTDHTLIIVTGQLYHDLYDDDRVVQALQRLPATVKIDVYHEEPIDPESARFFKELEERKATFTQIASACISHGAIFDDLHVKIEQFGVPNTAKDKHVDYYAFDAERACRARDDIEALARGELKLAA